MLTRLRRMLVGDAPHALALLATPTLLSLTVDVVLRGGTVLGFATWWRTLYVYALIVSAGFWTLPLFFLSRLLVGDSLEKRTKQNRERMANGIFIAIVFPLLTFSFGAQVLYFRVFHAYMGRNTIELGVALRGTVHDWFASLGSPLALGGMVFSGAALTVALFVIVRRVAPLLALPLAGRVPIFPVAGFVVAIFSLWNDYVDTRLLQASPPDVCFLHGAVHALRSELLHEHGAKRGVSRRTPAPLPQLVSEKSHPPNVLLLLTESVRADALCSDPPPACSNKFLDDAAADRISLGKLTSPTPNTFSACMALWTGLTPAADFRAAHSAPMLWEIARALRYRTAYVTAQNPRYEDFGAYVQTAGIDELVMAGDLGGIDQEQLGAPDERATDAALHFVQGATESSPYFLVLHLSNTHSPYRVDPSLEPFTPHASDPLGDVDAFHNHYRNSVLLQERTIASFLRQLRALPSWDDTVVIFLSDHGEQFREHGGLYHNHSLYDEELRVPGWLLAGAHAIDDDARSSLRSYASSRTYTQDIFATVVDLFGLAHARASFPYANLTVGRSLLRPRDPCATFGSACLVIHEAVEPTMLLATETAVWTPDDVRLGAMRGDWVVMGAPSGPWTCFDTAHDPAENKPFAASACGDLESIVKRDLAGAE